MAASHPPGTPTPSCLVLKYEDSRLVPQVLAHFDARQRRVKPSLFLFFFILLLFFLLFICMCSMILNEYALCVAKWKTNLEIMIVN